MSTHLLFSYGTLQLKRVQLETYGRELKGEKDELLGYVLDNVEITSPDVLEKSGEKFHPIAVKTDDFNDKIPGVVFEITEKELQQTDLYEVSDYKRVLGHFSSGKKAWVYVADS